MKKGTKKMLAYGVAAVAVYYFYNRTMSMAPMLVPQSVPVNTQGAKDPSLQLYGIGNPPNWY
jgi:hypothetical protein